MLYSFKSRRSRYHPPVSRAKLWLGYQLKTRDDLEQYIEPRITIHSNKRKTGAKLSQHKLITALLARSQSKVWWQAQLEWEFVAIYKGNGGDSCLCGHTPIIELCKLRNKLNHNNAIVGNCCVKRFLRLQTDLIFNAVKRIEKDSIKSVNLRTLNLAIREAWITEWEFDFYQRIHRKQFKNLTPKQASIKIDLNQKILRRIRTNKK